MNYTQIINENTIRLRKIRDMIDNYNPYTGDGSFSIDRVKITILDAPIGTMWLPVQMVDTFFTKKIIEAGSFRTFIVDVLKVEFNQDTMDQAWLFFEQERFKYDFEYWAIMTVQIEPKRGGDSIPFLLNFSQRKYLKILCEMFFAGVPINIILVKARQWGGSTLTQMFMAWIQLIHKTNWNSVICAHVESTARTIKGMYTKMLKTYPVRYTKRQQQLLFTPYERSNKTSIIKDVECRVTIGSAEKPDGVRGEHTSMCHASEVGLWKKTEGKMPEDIVQAITSGILDVPCSMIIYESTAKGVGNFFHNEWKRAVRGESVMRPFFVSWMDIPELYSRPVKNYVAFIDAMNDYEWLLWKKGNATLEQICWYRWKSKSMEAWRMMSEFPSWADEAFQSTGRMVFKADDIHRLRTGCEPASWKGDITGDAPFGKKAMENIKWIEDNRGRLEVWAMPDKETRMTRRYVVAVDFGGRSDTSDFSTIKVLDRCYMTEPGGVPEVVAKWKGHEDLDIVIWKAVQIAQEYNDALLIPEANTVESRETEGSHGEFIFNEIAGVYRNLYCRTSADQIRQGMPAKWGFWTGTGSKALLVDVMVRVMREDGYVERDDETCDELQIYEVHEDGTFGNVVGKDNHDDLAMATMIGVFVCYDFKRFALPEYYQERMETRTVSRTRTAADF